MKVDKLDRIFSTYIRLVNSENGMVKCCTCGKPMEISKAHCGHFISRRHLATRFDEKNCAPQCPYCNTFNQGEQFKFSIYIDKKYGKGTAEKLLIQSKQTCKLGQFEIDQMTKYYKEKVKELKTLKK